MQPRSEYPQATAVGARTATPRRPASDPHARLYAAHRWDVQPGFNIPQACLRRWADGSGRTAIRIDDGTAQVHCISFDDVQADADRLASGLAAMGVQAGQRVAYILPQGRESLAVQMAILQLGAVAMPLSMLFGPEALLHRLHDSEARVVLCHVSRLEALREIAVECPRLGHLIAADGKSSDAAGAASKGPAPHVHDYATVLATGSTEFQPADVGAEDPAYLIYTSGTTGPPKGALIPHRALLGNLPGFVLSQNEFPQAADVFWSPADWAWTGGLMDALLPTLFFGHPIVASTARFDAAKAFALMERNRVTNAFLFPTALKMMMKAVPRPREQFTLRLRAVMSAGEAVGTAAYEWCEQALGVRVNEMFGQTEINYLVGNSARWPARPGSIGKPYPGHRIAVLNDKGLPCAAGETGEVAAHRLDIHGTPDPVFFIGYWNNDKATRAKFVGDAGMWCMTGDLASVDEDGFYWYQGRADDMFKAAGYRIGPDEIENCLLKHPAVANAAVVPSPEAERGNIIKAFIVLTPGHVPSPGLVAQLQEHVRGKLAPYEYPKEIEFIAELPMTTTGKVQRRVLRLREAEKYRPAVSA